MVETPNDGLLLEVIEDYHRSIGRNLYVKCKKGSRSNFASIPSLCHFVFKPDDPIIAEPAVVHDVLVEEFTRNDDYVIYALNADQEEVPLFHKVDWALAADIFHLLMVETAVRNRKFTFLNRQRIAVSALCVRLYDIVRKK